MSIESIGNKCCGCRACLQKCKLGAISIVTDKYGFEYPEINTSLCTNCGLCESVCPVENEGQAHVAKECGYAYSLDAQTKFNGSSGGLFGTFAENVISQGGAVFGAAFDNELKLKTTKAETKEELLPLYKSKYLLCDTSYQFVEIEKELKAGRTVLYCSSPCQISALKLFLKKEYENLFLVDFICHGVGSQTLFDKSIEYTEKKESIEIDEVMLRYKKAKASSSHYYRYTYTKNGIKKERSGLYFSFPYYNGYCKRLVCRDSCYDCKFASEQRFGDITIGDFHTIEKYCSNIDRFAGVSMFLVNTEKGQKLFDAVKDKIFWQTMDKEIVYKNNRFSNTETAPSQQVAFRESIAGESFEKTVKRFLKPSKDWKKLLYYKSPKFLRKLIMR